MFGGSFQLPATAELYFVVGTVLNDLITLRSAEVGSWEEPPSIRLTVAKTHLSVELCVIKRRSNVVIRTEAQVLAS